MCDLCARPSQGGASRACQGVVRRLLLAEPSAFLGRARIKLSHDHTSKPCSHLQTILLRILGRAAGRGATGKGHVLRQIQCLSCPACRLREPVSQPLAHKVSEQCSAAVHACQCARVSNSCSAWQAGRRGVGDSAGRCGRTGRHRGAHVNGAGRLSRAEHAAAEHAVLSGKAGGAGGNAARRNVPLWRLAAEAEACSELRARALCQA